MRTDEQPIRLTLFAPDGRMGRAIDSAAAMACPIRPFGANSAIRIGCRSVRISAA